MKWYREKGYWCLVVADWHVLPARWAVWCWNHGLLWDVSLAWEWRTWQVSLGWERGHAVTLCLGPLALNYENPIGYPEG